MESKQNDIQALLILDSRNGERILSKYFEDSGLVGDEEQLNFELSLLQKIREVKHGFLIFKFSEIN